MLHHEHTKRYFRDAKADETALRRYINDYEKTIQFLEKEKWVHDLCSEGKLSQAIERSKRFEPEHGSYTNIHEAFDVMLNDMQSKQVVLIKK